MRTHTVPARRGRRVHYSGCVGNQASSRSRARHSGVGCVNGARALAQRYQRARSWDVWSRTSTLLETAPPMPPGTGPSLRWLCPGCIAFFVVGCVYRYTSTALAECATEKEPKGATKSFSSRHAELFRLCWQDLGHYCFKRFK